MRDGDCRPPLDDRHDECTPRLFRSLMRPLVSTPGLLCIDHNRLKSVHDPEAFFSMILLRRERDEERWDRVSFACRRRIVFVRLIIGSFGKTSDKAYTLVLGMLPGLWRAGPAPGPMSAVYSTPQASRNWRRDDARILVFPIIAAMRRVSRIWSRDTPSFRAAPMWTFRQLSASLAAAAAMVTSSAVFGSRDLGRSLVISNS